MKKTIVVMGLGPGCPEQLTRQAWNIITGQTMLFLRTGNHPIVPTLPKTVQLETFDHLYQENDSFEPVYEQIVDQLFQALQDRDTVVYAVPGDPMVGEATVTGVQRRAHEEGIAIQIVHGISFIEPILERIGWDGLEGVHVADAMDIARLHHPCFNPDAHIIIGQIYSKIIASDVKLTLMNQYPSTHPVILVHGAGTPEENIEHLQLFEIDRSDQIANMTALVLPPVEIASSFEAFQNTVAHLRSPEGCPWDQEQTHASLRMHILEECYEVLQAIDSEDMGALREELGDLTLQIVLQAQIATETDHFRMADVLAHINEKLIRRHPHVFGGLEVEGVEEVLHNWESLKASERSAQGENGGALDGVPLGLPALSQANEIQGRASRVGFDWPAIEGVVDKVNEELVELQEAETPERKAEEYGDLLFALVNFARWLDIDPESALRQANQRFRDRFGRMEAMARLEATSLSDLDIDALERLWIKTKS